MAVFWHDGVTNEDWGVGIDVALVCSWPIGIAIHELGHVLAAAIAGQAITGLRISPIGGSVGIEAFSSAAERWFIFVAGNLAVTVAGALAAALGGFVRRWRPAVRQMLIVSALIQLVAHLVLIPAAGLWARTDWSVIYHFRATFALSASAAVAHACVLIVLWCWWARSLRWVLRAMCHGIEEQRRFMLEIARRPNADMRSLLAVVNFAERFGNTEMANRAIRQASVKDPECPDILLARATIALRRCRWQAALALTDKALSAPNLDEPLCQRLLMHRGVALAEPACTGRRSTNLVSFTLRSPTISVSHTTAA